jgi:hypothetical protein
MHRRLQRGHLLLELLRRGQRGRGVVTQLDDVNGRQQILAILRQLGRPGAPDQEENWEGDEPGESELEVSVCAHEREYVDGLRICSNIILGGR